jgi:hypothetical protein
MCDDNHAWDVFAEDAAEPPSDAAYCPIDGFEAVTARRMPPADRVRVTIVPAARIADDITEAVIHEDRYCLEVSSTDGQHALRSTTEFAWDDAVARAAWFKQLTWADAVNRWRRTGLT